MTVSVMIQPFLLFSFYYEVEISCANFANSTNLQLFAKFEKWKVTNISSHRALPAITIDLFFSINLADKQKMSAKSEEEQTIFLPQSLGKLEIVPAIESDHEHHAPVNLNPFILRNTEPEISSFEREKIFGPSCSCSQNASNKVPASANKEFSVKKSAQQFKPRKRHEFILKQPMLKRFVRCLHHCNKETRNVVSRNESNFIEKHSRTEPAYDGSECNWSLRNNFSVDFRSLNLSESQPCTSSSDLHKSNSFKYPQCERMMGNQQSPLSTPNNDRINQQNVSCSQQAMWKPTTTNGDVTTDELACYFETIVHIPKKMSSMAEMMYIWVFFFVWSETDFGSIVPELH